ncbi:MAG: hypothetical protein A4E41_00186 [Methanoregulaceae archaeon PtaU1.Bin066]|nr:MAG: hypothetical protein A4E41_00186 [Methanoregulaceae archaeon PtaU1.Bin066]
MATGPLNTTNETQGISTITESVVLGTAYNAECVAMTVSTMDLWNNAFLEL